nr:MAG TPA: Lipopolysaccharide core biosynthesis protein core biosynthesis protein, Structural [Caudoviricetes sp.]
MKTAVFAFARMQPPTKGHIRVVNVIQQLATENHGDAMVFLSRSEGDKKNPIPFDVKREVCIEAFREEAPCVTFPDIATIKSPLNVFRWLAEQGYENVIMVAGGDRNGKYFDLVERQKTRFKYVALVSAGERDDEFLSASEVRDLAVNCEFCKFWTGTANLSLQTALYLYKLIVEASNPDAINSEVFTNAPTRHHKEPASVGAERDPN